MTNRKASMIVAMAATAVLSSFAAFFAFRDAAPRNRAPASTSVASAAPSASDASPPTLVLRSQPAASAATSAPGAALLAEGTLMDALRARRFTDPSFTLSLAREGNQRFGESADAAERAWFVVKALSDLGRQDEARLEGRTLVDKYRETRWAEDVYRHLFVNPPTHPLERGYGKKLESDP